ncbi:NADH:ubiquinone oxidoreductase [Vermiconidia calcicola]|uniref:NADH:ubiquinone oxidoreductase n=1 Tax=Vermiconidia calcicola TaxID=1690605 RepID=A0ACC3N9D8_9PEZI|nr:NADH:ubiquinone oxidoreductase [Vermiconidia calcicola]
MSSPMRPGATVQEELEYYKKQYEQLETDLADFQASSKELEEQLERDIEAAEKNERKLKEQVEKVKFEAEEWKTKHQQAKTEANKAQNALQKEITTLRDSNRTMQLKLRDIEVMNDDYERQARNTESSLEDMESKHNVAIERSVLMEDELKNGEQEREGLRIETQRLRDELGDLKVESEITLGRLRQADDTIERLRSRKPSPLAVESLRARSPGSEASGITAPSPTASTPPPKSDSVSDALTPPSPPLSDTPVHAKVDPKTPVPRSRRSLILDAGLTPRPGLQAPRTQPEHARGPSTTSSVSAITPDLKAMKPPAKPRQVSRESSIGVPNLPRSDSLYQIRNLRGRMQKIEERVQSARSKLPPQSKNRTPKGSPSTRSELGDALPASVTTRRSIKRPSSNLGSQVDGLSDVPPETASRRESQVKRLSFGIPRPGSVASNRPASVASNRPGSGLDRPPSAAAVSRPSSRSSMVSGSVNQPTGRAGARTPLFAGTRGTSSFARPSSSMTGNYATIHGTPRGHRPSASTSISEMRWKTTESEDSSRNISPSRRTTFDRSGLSKAGGTIKRQSGGLPQLNSTVKRPSTGFGQSKEGGSMKPPPRRKMSDVGETY